LTDPDPYLLAGSQNLHADPAQGFDVHEDIPIIIAALDEAIALIGIEPFDCGTQERALGNDLRVIGVTQRRRRIVVRNRRTDINLDDAKSLQPFRTSNRFTDDRGAFVYRVVSGGFQRRMVNEYIAGIVWQCYEPETF
jgi:hypothetical protein